MTDDSRTSATDCVGELVTTLLLLTEIQAGTRGGASHEGDYTYYESQLNNVEDGLKAMQRAGMHVGEHTMTEFAAIRGHQRTHNL